MVNKLKRSCYFCGDLGLNIFKIRNGIIIQGNFICGQCHQDISHISINQERYEFLKEQFKTLLFKGKKPMVP